MDVDAAFWKITTESARRIDSGSKPYEEDVRLLNDLGPFAHRGRLCGCRLRDVGLASRWNRRSSAIPGGSLRLRLKISYAVPRPHSTAHRRALRNAAEHSASHAGGTGSCRPAVQGWAVVASGQ